jgi:hypothetical protein
MSDEAPELWWYYAVDGQQFGPVGDAELRELIATGRLRPRDLVWNESMGDRWQQVAEATGQPDAAGPLPPGPTEARSDAGAPAPAAAANLAIPVYERKYGPPSCTDPVTPAYERMKDILFRPFNLGRWFAIGFCAWLAAFGAGGGGISVPTPSGSMGQFFSGMRDMSSDFGQGPSLGQMITPMVAGIVLLVLLIAIPIGLAMHWLRCRGRFMFLDNVVHNRDWVKQPWGEFREQAHSLFWWLLAFGILTLLFALLLAALVFVTSVLPAVRAGTVQSVAVGGLVTGAVLLIVFALVCAYILRFLEDFVVPIMYLRRCSTTEAWREFMPLFRERRGGFIVYGLFFFVLSLLAGAVTLMLVALTCCLALCPMMIPYIGTVFLLPLPTFFRCYSLEYLSQFGPAYDVWAMTDSAASGGDAV